MPVNKPRSPSPPPTTDLDQRLRRIPWFQRLRPEHFAALREITTLKDVLPGAVLFREGDPQDYLYIVLEGRVALEIYVPGRGRVRLLTLDPMEVFGWSSVVPQVRRRTATAIALVPTRLAALDAQALLQLCETDPELGCLVMRRLSNVIAKRLLVTRLQLLDMYAQPHAGEVRP